MPTNIPLKRNAPILYLAFVCALFIAAIVVEVIGPARVEVNAVTVAAP